MCEPGAWGQPEEAHARGGSLGMPSPPQKFLSPLTAKSSRGPCCVVPVLSSLRRRITSSPGGVFSLKHTGRLSREHAGSFINENIQQETQDMSFLTAPSTPSLRPHELVSFSRGHFRALGSLPAWGSPPQHLTIFNAPAPRSSHIYHL